MNAHVSPEVLRTTAIDHLTAIACGHVNTDRKLVFVVKPGRPPIADPASERSRKPWLAEGISQRTFYRRKAAAEAAKPVQQSAHVVAWYGAAGPIARLEYRAMIRRCLKSQMTKRIPA